MANKVSAVRRTPASPLSSPCSQFLPLVVSLLSSASWSSLSQRLQLSGQMSPALQAFPEAVPCPPTSVPFLCVPGLRGTYHHLKSQLSCFAVECLSAPGECELHGARQTCLSWSSRGHQLLEQRLRRLRYWINTFCVKNVQFHTCCVALPLCLPLTSWFPASSHLTLWQVLCDMEWNQGAAVRRGEF